MHPVWTTALLLLNSWYHRSASWLYILLQNAFDDVLLPKGSYINPVYEATWLYCSNHGYKGVVKKNYF